MELLSIYTVLENIIRFLQIRSWHFLRLQLKDYLKTNISHYDVLRGGYTPDNTNPNNLVIRA